MRRWEYIRALKWSPGETTEAALDRLGANGWELVVVVLVDGLEVFYLKREVSP